MDTTLMIQENNIADEYTIHWSKPVGSGINGDVYLCTNNLSGIQYAVKILPFCIEALDEVTLQWSCRESCNIVKIIDVYINGLGDDDEECIFIVMELMNGGELFDHLQQKQISEEEAKQFVKQILKAIEFIHEGNIVHRDLKPENILMDVSTSEEEKAESITLKLADFGYAEMDDNGLTNPLYTLYYVAPEVLSNDTRFRKESDKACPPMTYDKKCDIWSLGVITYIMLMGYPPFSPDGPNIEMTSTMYQSILSGDYYYGEMDWKKYSGDAHDFVFSLLHVNPEDRPCAKELLLHPWLQSNSVRY
ncbi:hypothetical protein LOD99_14166 [Oopsacas minuta]|uniref:Protein kinase domain-containing protein n=1 Tax=Oopsacas minuta TaxID=111878 RepID=A0AAV7KGX8_9METZ|nr:hypothetical protein LOD99_14166 [Oopsacas minuta]